MSIRKRIISLMLAFLLLLSACGQNPNAEGTSKAPETTYQSEEVKPVVSLEETTLNHEDKAQTMPLIENSEERETLPVKEPPVFDNLGDPAFLQYIQDTIYADLEGTFADDEYTVDDVSVIYISKEYLEEVEYNSKSNIFFGYTLDELDQRFLGKKYYFTLSETGETVVKEAGESENKSLLDVVNQVVGGNGTVLISAAIKLLSKEETVQTILVSSAGYANILGHASGALAAVIAGVVTGIETQDIHAAVSAASKVGAEGYKWGALAGAAVDGYINLKESKRLIPTACEAVFHAIQKYCGTDPTSYLSKMQTMLDVLGISSPDFIRELSDGRYEAVEVKNYDLELCYDQLEQKLIEQISARVNALPEGWAQRVIINVEGRQYTKVFVSAVVEMLKKTLQDYDPDLIIDVMGDLLD